MNVVLINTYELGRQSFGLAQPAAWLRRDGFEVNCIDLAMTRLDPRLLEQAGIVAIYLPMHTATRIALELVPKVRSVAPQAKLCVYGLYAPTNEELFRSLGVSAVFGGEVEPQLLSWSQRVRDHGDAHQSDPVTSLAKIAFLAPDRSQLPPLTKYAHLRIPDGTQRVVGFAEASRGCKHLCRHCPVVPVYNGKFRVVPEDVVMADIRNQIDAGAQHISFGDPDFFNGPTHAVRIVKALHAEFPHITYDATIKIQHLVQHQDLVGLLAQTGCMFITSAVESIDPLVLDKLQKNHSVAEFREAVKLVRQHGIELAPTFVPFSPWTTLEGFIELLEILVELDLVEAVPPVQLSIRLLVPQGSYLLHLPDMLEFISEFDPGALGYRWRHRDPRVDELQRRISELVSKEDATDRSEVFADIWEIAHQVLGRAAARPELKQRRHVPHMSEPWYCCAEPTTQQLQSF